MPAEPTRTLRSMWRGAGNVIMAAGLRATAKAGEHAPEPKVGAPVFDPTKRLVGQTASRYLVLQLRYKEGCSSR
jgi:hypothetical protein